MNTLSQLLQALRKAAPSLQIKYRYPVLYAIIIDDSLENVPEEERAGSFLRNHNLSEQEIEELVAASGLNLIFCTSSERLENYSFLDEQGAISHWAGVMPLVPMLKV